MDEIAESLRRRSIRWVCHVTPCRRLPSIFAHGGLLSYDARQACGIPEDDQTPHYWGPKGRKEAFGAYVICSFMPSWGLIQGHVDELAIVILDAVSVCCRPGVVFCPTNSARSMFTEEAILRMTGSEAFEACFPNPDTYQAGDSEIFVPEIVPLTDFRGMVFWDEGSKVYWWEQVKRSVEQANPRPTLSQPICVSTNGPRGLWGFRFPGNWQPTRRHCP